MWDGLKQEDLKVINSLLTEPVWKIKKTKGSEDINFKVFLYKCILIC
jgi:hypothetical protein